MAQGTHNNDVVFFGFTMCDFMAIISTILSQMRERVISEAKREQGLFSFDFIICNCLCHLIEFKFQHFQLVDVFWNARFIRDANKYTTYTLHNTHTFTREQR